MLEAWCSILLSTGAALTLPATRPLDTFPTEVHGENVYIHLPRKETMSELIITDLHAKAEKRKSFQESISQYCRGKYALMGPNGSGKSTLAHILMGRPGYEITQGNISLNGEDITNKPTWQRAQLGLFLAMQYPVEIDGVTLPDLLNESSSDISNIHDLISHEADL